jgi:hypothetical protein
MDWGKSVQFRDRAEAEHVDSGSATPRLRSLGVAYDCREKMV